jgi:hypothetical protein
VACPTDGYGTAVSQGREIVVRLDVAGSEVQAVADKVTEFLLARHVIARNPRRDQLWDPSEWIPGAGMVSVLEPHHELQRILANNGVDVIVERALYHPFESYEPPVCARCACAFDEQEHCGTIEAWMDGTEPTLTCRACGWSALAGDLPVTSAMAVGAPAVAFNNWPPLTQPFTTELREVMCGRTQIVRAHT